LHGPFAIGSFDFSEICRGRVEAEEEEGVFGVLREGRRWGGGCVGFGEV